MDVDRLHSILGSAGVDALVIRLGENILAASGYWPALGASCAVLTDANVPPVLILPRREREFLPGDYDGEVVLYEPEGDADATMAGWAKQFYPAGAKQIGYDTHGGLATMTNAVGEVRLPSMRWYNSILTEGGSGKNCSDAIMAYRMLKTSAQADFIRRAERFALTGLQRAFDALLKPGVTEIQLASRIESEIENQLGSEGSQRVRAFAAVQAGPNSALAADTISISGAYPFRAGDLVVVELGTVVDGYWSDITRTVCVGTPSAQTQALLDVVRAGQQAAFAAMKPGVAAKAVDAAARAALGESSQFFTHSLGHGVGFAYHELPWMNAASDAVLAEGMVLTVEPGVYFPGQFGVRLEDNILVTADGIDILSAVG